MTPLPQVESEPIGRIAAAMLEAGLVDSVEDAERLLDVGQAVLEMEDAEWLEFLHEQKDRYEQDSALYQVIETTGYLNADRAVRMHELVLVESRDSFLKQRTIELLVSLARHAPEQTARLMVEALEDEDPEVAELADHLMTQVEIDSEDFPVEALEEFLEAVTAMRGRDS